MLIKSNVLDDSGRVSELAVFEGLAEVEELGDPPTLELRFRVVLLTLFVDEEPTPLVNEKDVDEAPLIVDVSGVDKPPEPPLMEPAVPDDSAAGILDGPGKIGILSDPPPIELDIIELFGVKLD